MRKCILFLLMICTLFGLWGCDGRTVIRPDEGNASNSPVSGIRSGILSQGSTSLCNGFETTDTGVYFLVQMDNGTYIMYSDHTSDTAIKLCGRVDCKHSDNSCNAFFPYAENICYYDGHLYIETGFGANVTITRLDLDGTNRIKVMDTSYLAGDYRGSNGVYITNGICVFSLFKLDADGKEISDQYYWKLDGTMEQAKRTPELIMFYSAGAELLMKGKSNSDSMSSNGLYLWDIDTNTSHYLTDLPTSNPGYWGTETGYYVQDGVIYKKTYFDDSIEKVFDTKLQGDFQFHGFPDCIMLSEFIPWEDQDHQILSEQTLRFYSWDYDFLGEVKLDYPVFGTIDYMNTVCGETADRIYLAAHFYGVPEYYINKSDLSTGNIQVHRLKLPEDVLAYFHNWE